MAHIENNRDRVIIGHALHDKPNSGGVFGFVRPIAELDEEGLRELNPANFCPTMKVFIPGEYSQLESRFPDGEIFRLTVKPSEPTNSNLDPSFACRYVSYYDRTEAVKPKDLFEIISSELPDPNQREVVVNGHLPGTSYIFIDDGDGHLYGPFKWRVFSEANEAIILSFIESKLPSVNLAPYQIYEIKSRDVSSKIFISDSNRKARRFVWGLSIINNASFYDYASDEEIVKFASKLASDVNVKLVDKRNFTSLTQVLQRNQKFNLPLHKQRLSRLSHIVEDVVTMQESTVAGILEFLKSDNGKPLVQKYVEINQKQFFEVIKKERESEINVLLEAKKDEIKIAEARLRTLNESKIQFSAEVEDLKRLTKQEAMLDKAHAEADKKLQQQKQELAEIEKLLTEKSAIAENLISLEDIQSRIKAADADWKRAIERSVEQRRQNEEVRREGLKSEEELRTRLVTMRPFVDAINGAIAPVEFGSKDISINVNEFSQSDSLVTRQREIVGEMCRQMAARCRSMTVSEMANILICTQQSFITFLAGMPGVGKTSLARLLAEIQGLGPKRLTEVAVGRGWTSQKDLIGFYNPLSSRFQAAGTGLYDFLVALSGEKNSKAAMAYVLLDEANLSPIEHYWSAFMGMTDRGGKSVIRLGDKDVNIPDHLRFIATINYDGTTEPLSPRIVDRAPVILLDAEHYESDDIQLPDDLPAHPLPISSVHMQELFGIDLQPEFEDSEQTIFNRLHGILRSNNPEYGRPVSISPRKIQAIQQFCTKARGIMNVDSEFLALDLAVLQHVLPLVRGNGPKFSRRLESLQRELEGSGLGASANYVTKMLNNGADDLDTYDFFCW